MTTIAVGTTQTTGYVASIDNSGNLVFQTNGTTTAMTLDTSQNANIVGRVTAAGANINGNSSVTGVLTINRLDNSNEGGQLDLCRSIDNASAWGIDVYGNSNNTIFRVIDNANAAVRIAVTATGNVGINTSTANAKFQVDGSAIIKGNDTLLYFGNTGLTGELTGSPNTHFIGRVDTSGYHVTSNGSTGFGSANGDFVIGSHGSILLSTANSSLTYPTGRIRITGDGYTVSNSQPGFLVTSFSTADFNAGTGTTNVWKGGTTQHNVGNVYNSTNGRFTAPIAGFYLITGGVLISSGTGRLEASVEKNDVQVIALNGTGTTYDGPCFSVIVYMATGDYITVRRLSGVAYGVHTNNYYSARLLV